MRALHQTKPAGGEQPAGKINLLAEKLAAHHRMISAHAGNLFVHKDAISRNFLPDLFSIDPEYPPAAVSRFSFPGKNLVNGIVDIPIVLPPLVIGLSLLILFQTLPGKAIESAFVRWIGWVRVNDLLGLVGIGPHGPVSE